jgi:hypothetical protein
LSLSSSMVKPGRRSQSRTLKKVCSRSV